MDYAAKIAALIAKAEATEFEGERDTFLAKASELQLKWMISDSDVRASMDRKDVSDYLIRTAAEGVDKNSAFVKAKRDMLTGLCSIFHVKITMYRDRSGMTLFGFASDVAFVRQLHASLVVQMLAAMERENTRDRSFRTSFAHGYAQRVVARLQEARTRQERDASSSMPGTALVLRDRSTQVQAYFDEQLSGVRLRSGYKNRSVRSAAGHAAGRIAGDRADVGGTRVAGVNRDALPRG